MKPMKPTERSVPTAVQEIALRMLTAVPPRTCGTSRIVDGWVIETHTLGCRYEAGTPEEDWWDEHYRIYDDYVGDDVSLVLGEPVDGKFVSITTTRKNKRSGQLDAEIAAALGKRGPR